MRSKILLKLVCVCGLVGASFSAIQAGNKSPDGGVPVVCQCNPINPGPGAKMQITVQVDAASGTGEFISLGCTNAGTFTDLPSEVFMPAGASSISIVVHTGSGYQAGAQIVASAGSVSVLSPTLR